MQTITGEETGKCPCCNGIHGIYVRTNIEQNVIDGRTIRYAVSSNYCPFVEEGYETEEQFRNNVQALMDALREKGSRYISQKKITELLQKFEKRKGEECTNVFIASHGQ